MTKLKFEELNLGKDTLSAIKDMGFEEASPIQSASIPVIMDGSDIIGQAQTGTGKTAAFAIPVVEKIDEECRDIQALILCPTRELVIQVSNEFRKLMKYKENLCAVPVYGGQPIERQLASLKKNPQVIIGTPGRLMDHIKRGSIKLNEVKTVILDEADEMLDMGFRDDIEFILSDTPKERQTVLFSATLPKDIRELTKKYQKNPIVIDVTQEKVNRPKIQQTYFEVIEKNKPEVLARLIDLHNIRLALVFCNTKSQVDELVEILKTRGYFADALHGDLNQNQRDKVMNGFRNGIVEILVATDVAGRGIDVNNVEAVFNYDLPRDEEDYTHRIGRTARAGKTGLAFTFVTGRQVYNLKRIERANGVQIHRSNVPTMDEIEMTRINGYLCKVSEIIEEGHLSKYINQIDLMIGDEHTSLDVAAALLKIITEKENENFDYDADFKTPPVEEKRPDRKRSFNKFDKFDKKPARGGSSNKRFGGGSDNGGFKSRRKPKDSDSSFGFDKENANKAGYKKRKSNTETSSDFFAFEKESKPSRKSEFKSDYKKDFSDKPRRKDSKVDFKDGGFDKKEGFGTPKRKSKDEPYEKKDGGFRAAKRKAKDEKSAKEGKKDFSSKKRNK